MGVLERKLDAKKAKDNELIAKKNKLLKRDIEIASATPEGLNLLKWIFDTTGYAKVLVVGNPDTKDINLVGTLYNEARRGLWVEIRQHIPNRTLKKIEFEKLNLNVEEL